MILRLYHGLGWSTDDDGGPRKRGISVIAYVSESGTLLRQVITMMSLIDGIALLACVF